MKQKIITLVVACLVAETNLACASDWPTFRGPAAQSNANGDSIPAKWSIEDGTNVAWTADLPGRGVSGPIVVDGKVIITASSGPKEDRLHILAFDEATGKQLWHRQFWATGRTLFHPMSANATPTPASDGERVFAFYSSNDLICVDLDGNLQWMQGLVLDHPKLGNDVGMSSSPTVAQGIVVVQAESQGDSFAAGFDAATGEPRWKIDRPKQAQWASPLAVRNAEGVPSAVLLQSMYGVSLHDPLTGSQLWEQKMPCAAIASTTVEDDRAFIPSDGLTVFSLDKTAEDKPIWKSPQLRPSNASPVIVDGKVYVIGSAGVLVCGDAETGGDTEDSWKRRLAGQFWATPVAVGNYLVCINSEGLAFVVDLTDDGKIVAKNDFKTAILGSPAVANNALFVRGHGKLWKIANTAVASRDVKKAPQ